MVVIYDLIQRQATIYAVLGKHLKIKYIPFNDDFLNEQKLIYDDKWDQKVEKEA